ncbi:MAG: hypothetical protein Q9177_001663 [Variospora cf. flavescens]
MEDCKPVATPFQGPEGLGANSKLEGTQRAAAPHDSPSVVSSLHQPQSKHD